MRIRVLDPAGLHHFASGFHAWEPGEYDFPNDPVYAGWLEGHVEAGNVVVLAPPTPPAAAQAAPAVPSRKPPTRKR